MNCPSISARASTSLGKAETCLQGKASTEWRTFIVYSHVRVTILNNNPALAGGAQCARHRPSNRLPVRFPVKGHARVVSQVPG